MSEWVKVHLYTQTQTVWTLATGSSHLEANEPFLPGVEAREVDLTECFMAQLEVDTVWGDGELEGHGLVGFCHCGYCSVVSLRRAQEDFSI